MFHLLAWSKSFNAAVFTDTDPVQDQIMSIVNGHFFPQQPLKLAFGVHLGTSAVESRLVTPKYRLYTSSDVLFASNRQATLLTQQRVSNFLNNPPVFAPLEEIEVDTLQDSGGAERENVVAGFFDSMLEPMPGGDVFVATATSTTAAVASTWTDLTVTFDTSLPNGKFAVVGLRHNAATAIACRLILPNQTFRPGCVSSVNKWDDTDPLFRRGGLGKWGEFVQSNLPKFQVLCNSTDASHAFKLDLIRIG